MRINSDATHEVRIYSRATHVGVHFAAGAILLDEQTLHELARRLVVVIACTPVKRARV